MNSHNESRLDHFNINRIINISRGVIYTHGDGIHWILIKYHLAINSNESSF